MRNILIFLCLFALLASCEGNKHKIASERVQADSLISHRVDSLYIDPAGTESIFRKAQKSYTDSGAKNRLELFIAMSRLVRGDRKYVDSVQARIGDYCKRHPKDHQLAGLYYDHRGILALTDSKNDSAITYFNKSYKQLILAGDTTRAIDVCINLSDQYRQKGDMSEAANVLQNAYSIGGANSPKTTLFAIHYMLGAIYSDMTNFEMAEKCFQRAEKLLPQATETDKFMFYNTRGNCHFFEKKYAKAQKNFEMSLKLADGMNNPVYNGIALSNLGEVLHSEGQSRKALPMLLKAEKILNDAGAADDRSKAYINDLIGSAYLHSGNKEMATRRFAATDTMALKGNPRYMMTHYDRLSDFYDLTGSPEQALKSLRKADAYRESFRNSLFREQMAEAHQRFMKDNQLLEQKRVNQRQQMRIRAIYIVSTSLIVLAIIGIIVIIQFERRRRQILQLKYEREVMALTLQNIRNRLSPHFIMNVLGRELSMNNEGIRNLIKFIRLNLLLVERSIVSLEDEIDFVNTYVSLETKALSSGFKYTCNVDPAIDAKNTRLPALMIQLFVENAVKHGLRGQSGDLFLTVDLEHVDDSIKIVIDNNGTIEQKTSLLSTKTGLNAVLQTTALYNKVNPRPIEINYGPKSNGVWHVSIVIPDGYKFKELRKLKV